MTKDDVFQELLDDWMQLKEDKIDHSYSGAPWQYQKISEQYKEWEKKYKEENNMDDQGASDYIDGYNAGVGVTLEIVSNWLDEDTINEVRERLSR